MAKPLTTQDRVMLLMSLVPYLKEHGPTPVADLAAKFSVAPEEVRQLTRFLGVAGVPGETQTYQHEDLFDIDWDALEQHDLVSLTQIVAVEETPRFSSTETAALIAGLHALEPMLPQPLQQTAQHTAAKLASVQQSAPRRGSVSITGDPVQQHLSEITTAISRGSRLKFDYRGADGVLGHRTVEPLLLGQSGGSWYLRAYCLDREAERTFMLDRMRAPEALATLAERTPLSDASSAIGVDGAEVTAQVRLTRAALQKIVDFAPRVLGETEQGWVRAEVDLLHPAVAVRLVQAAPAELVIEAPEAARAAAAEWARLALADYEA